MQRRELIETYILGTAVLSTLFLLGVFFKYAHFGFDFTDEGYYLNSIATPHSFAVSTTQFGFFYHPFFSLLSENVVAFRQFNIVSIFIVAWLLAYESLTFQSNTRLSRQSLFPALLGFVFAANVLVFFCTWILTPSYNSMNLIALMLTALGLIYCVSAKKNRNVWGWAIVGLGGGLCFLAKPSSASLLLFLALVFLIINRKFKFGLAVLGLLSSLAVIFATIIYADQSVASFFSRVFSSLAEAGLMSREYDFAHVFRVDSILLKSNEYLVVVVTILTGAFLGWAGASRQNWVGWASLIISILCIVFTICLVAGLVVLPTLGLHSLKIVIGAGSLGIALGLAVQLKRRFFKNQNRHSMYLASILFLFPFVYSFGTNNNYWQASSNAGFFWILSGIILLRQNKCDESSLKALVPFAAFSLFIVTFLISLAIQTPYRQTVPLWALHEELIIKENQPGVNVTSEQLRYISELRLLSKANGFLPESTILDFTGRSPGALYLMDGRVVGSAWFVGGYEGSNALSKLVLQRLGCLVVANSWILTETSGGRSIDPKILKIYNLDLKDDFEMVGEIDSPYFKPNKSLRQNLWKPIPKTKACLGS